MALWIAQDFMKGKKKDLKEGELHWGLSTC